MTFDNRLTRVILIYLQNHYSFNIDKQTHLRGKIKHIAEQVKKGLSRIDKFQLTEKIRLLEYEEPVELNLLMSRELFKKQCEDIIERSFKICDDAFSSLSFSPKEIDDVIRRRWVNSCPSRERDGRKIFWSPSPHRY